MKTISPPVAATQVTGIKIVGDDGVTSVTLYQDTQARTAAENIDLFFDFLSDLNLTTLTVSVTAANAGRQIKHAISRLRQILENKVLNLISRGRW